MGSFWKIAAEQAASLTTRGVNIGQQVARRMFSKRWLAAAGSRVGSGFSSAARMIGLRAGVETGLWNKVRAGSRMYRGMLTGGSATNPMQWIMGGTGAGASVTAARRAVRMGTVGLGLGLGGAALGGLRRRRR